MKISKETIRIQTIVLLMVYILSACGKDDVIIDYAPVVISVKVQNEAGDNLLDPSVAGNILDRDISVTYEGNNYPIESVDESGRFWPGFWRGVILVNGQVLEIGEFDGSSAHEDCVLHIGTRDIPISYDAKFNGMKVKRTYYFDGKQYKIPEFTRIL